MGEMRVDAHGAQWVLGARDGEHQISHRGQWRTGLSQRDDGGAVSTRIARGIERVRHAADVRDDECNSPGPERAGRYQLLMGIKDRIRWYAQTKEPTLQFIGNKGRCRADAIAVDALRLRHA